VLRVFRPRTSGVDPLQQFVFENKALRNEAAGPQSFGGSRRKERTGQWETAGVSRAVRLTRDTAGFRAQRLCGWPQDRWDM